MCAWEQYCRFAREPERRKVGIDARVSVDGTAYEVEPDMAGETVLLLWGLFDSELYVEYEGARSGPYHPVSDPIPLGRYRAFKRGAAGERADRIRSLADQLKLPIAALAGEDLRLAPLNLPIELPIHPLRCGSARIPFRQQHRRQAGDRQRLGAAAGQARASRSGFHRPGAGRDAEPQHRAGARTRLFSQ